MKISYMLFLLATAMNGKPCLAQGQTLCCKKQSGT